MAIIRNEGASQNRLARQREADEKLALSALQYMIGDEDVMMRFFAETGLAPDTLRDAAQAPQFWGSVLDFICAGDDLIVAFAAQEKVRPESIMAARMRLSGPQHWDSI